jgi:hypothetical protein
MNDGKFCGKILYKNEEYGVFIEGGTDFIWVNKTNDATFGKGNFGNYKARNEKEALELAHEMLKNSGK